MLTVKNLRKSFGTAVAVKDVSFFVASGQILGLLGPNGAGKTTTLSMIAGLLRPERGEGLIAGHRLAGGTDGAEPQRDLREPRGTESRGQGAALHDALHGRSRAARRSDRDRRSRQRRRRRHARWPAVAGGDRRRSGDSGIGISDADRKEPAGLM